MACTRQEIWAQRRDEHLFSHIRMIQKYGKSTINTENIMLSEDLVLKAFPVDTVESITRSDVISVSDH